MAWNAEDLAKIEAKALEEADRLPMGYERNRNRMMAEAARALRGFEAPAPNTPPAAPPAPPVTEEPAKRKVWWKPSTW